MKKSKLAIFIFRRDLRLFDNTALHQAFISYESVLPCFIFDPRQSQKQNQYFGSHCFQFLLESLQDLNEQLKTYNSRLYIFNGLPHEVIQKLIDYTQPKAVYVNQDYTPFSIARDSQIQSVCNKKKVSFNSFQDLLLINIRQLPESFPKYKKFTPFYNKIREIPVRKILTQTNFNFYNQVINFQGKFPEFTFKEGLQVKGGRTQALNKLSNLPVNYAKNRDMLSTKNSQLSAYNKFGCISIRQFYFKIKEEQLRRQLYWRDFYYHICLMNEGFKCFQQKYTNIKWWNDTKEFDAWKNGITGTPIVDAAMRCLKVTGGMHNRLRMIVASYLTKDLIIDWRWGQKHFANYLIDYDPAQNNGGWQWAASTGTDSQPYFRIFNPQLQSQKFDPQCKFIKKWIPQLKSLPAKQIHTWQNSYKNHSNIKYARPIIIHQNRKQKILEIFTTISGKNTNQNSNTKLIESNSLEQKQVKLIKGEKKQYIIFIDETIGQGASAVVKKAYDKQQKRPLAVKIIDLSTKDNKEVAQKQLQIIQELAFNPHLVQIQKVKVESTNNLYIFMEYCNGGNLALVLKQKIRLDQISIYRLFCHLIQGYKALYDSKIIHEDIKPENILIHNNNYKISDFGLSIINRNYKYGNIRKGTLYYMAYQKLTRKQYYPSTKSDVYSLGILLYEAIIGKHPYVERRGLKVKQFISVYKQGKLNPFTTAQMNLKFLSFFEIILKMIAKSDEKRIDFPELYKWYDENEMLKPYKNSFTLENVKIEDEKVYNIVEMSQANIQLLELTSEQICQNSIQISTKLQNKQDNLKINLKQIEQLKNLIIFKRSIAFLLLQFTKYIENYKQTKIDDIQQFQKVELVCHLLRGKLLQRMEIPLINQLIFTQYLQDCNIVHTQTIEFMTTCKLKQSIKKTIISNLKEIQFHAILKILTNMLNNLLTNVFLVLKINFKQELELYAFISRVLQLFSKEEFNTQEINIVCSKMQESQSSIIQYIQKNINKYSVMVDPQQPNQPDSQEFQVLEWQEQIRKDQT